MSGGLVTDEEVARALSERPGWRRDGGALVRTIRMKDFEDALAFVERVAGAAVDYHRRPDMCIFANNRGQAVDRQPPTTRASRSPRSASRGRSTRSSTSTTPGRRRSTVAEGGPDAPR